MSGHRAIRCEKRVDVFQAGTHIRSLASSVRVSVLTGASWQATAIVDVHPHVSQIKQKTSREMQLKVAKTGIPALFARHTLLHYDMLITRCRTLIREQQNGQFVMRTEPGWQL